VSVPRWSSILAALGLLVALGFHYTWYTTHVPVGWRQCLADPAGHDGQALIFPLYTVTAVRGPQRYEISKALRDIPVVGDASDLERGTTVSVKGTFRASDGVVVASERKVHRYRGAKQALGVIGLLGGLLAFPLGFRFRRGGIEERA